MNPLTLVKRLQNITSREAELGISDEASWHAKYKDSAYVFVGGISFDLTEGDLLAVFAQYGEIVDVNLVRDKATGKSKGFAFVAYEDQRSTILAVDNLNGAKVCDRIVRVDHVTNYKKKEEEDEETMQAKREARGVCRAFQRGDCTRGASCKFSHDEQRAANTGWGAPGDRSPKWGHDKFGGPNKGEKRSGTERPLEGHLKQIDSMEDKRSRRLEDNEVERKSKEDYHGRDERRSRRHEGDAKLRDDEYRREEKRLKGHKDEEFDHKSRGDFNRSNEKGSKRHDDNQFDPRSREDAYRRDDRKSRRYDDELETRSRDNDGRREEKRIRKHDSEYSPREDQDKRGESRSSHGRDSTSTRHKERYDHRRELER
ncbi:RNA recognition motif (RRM)-containing protein [Euphorbia peplus]|nr:RNA recognition motif (RRM)-containing protein [Euphorbia peplus]